MRLPRATAIALGLIDGRPAKRRKYGNLPTERRAVGIEVVRERKVAKGDVIKFDSKREALRYDYHVARYRAGEVSSIEMQVRYDVVASGRYYYLADFRVTEASGKCVVEDVKSRDGEATATRLFALKRELVRERHGVEIVIV